MAVRVFSLCRRGIFFLFFRCFPNNPSPASREPPFAQGSHALVRFFPLYHRKNKTSPAAATAALCKGRLFLCKSYGCKGGYGVGKSFFRFFAPASGRSPLFSAFSPQSEGFRFRFGQRAPKVRSRVRVSVPLEVSSLQRITSTPIYLRSTSGTVTLPSAF